MPPLHILLATYNGARFLPEQLDSLLAQQEASWRLLWRDDGSTDGTRALLEAFARRTGRAAEAMTPPGRAGALGSFMHLLAAAPEGGHHAFCDQDDVWLPGKLARAQAALADMPEAQPALYCSRQRLVDAALRPTGLSPLPRRPLGFRNALVQNVVTGCTLVLNDAARRLVLAAPPPPPGTMHDWWCYLLVSGAGGRMCFDPEPGLLYRQHGANAVGTQASLLRRGVAAFTRGPERFLAVFSAHVERLLAAAPLLTAEARETLDLVAPLLALPRRERLGQLRRSGLYRQGVAEDAVLRLWLLMPPGGVARAALPRLNPPGGAGSR